MSHPSHRNLDYNRPIMLSDDVYWVGFQDVKRGLHCNPYLIKDGDQSILIDGGSRPEFSIVMRKILQTGIVPGGISHLIYQHYDPDLCGSLPNLEEMIGRKDLKIVSKKENNVFIRYYSVSSEMLCIDDLDHRLVLNSGRTLRFFPTPYAHSPGSFMTLDEKSGIMFTSDIFGAVSGQQAWSLFEEYESTCHHCLAAHPLLVDEVCGLIGKTCPWTGMTIFQRQIMTSNRALRYAMEQVRRASPKMIAPQHGSVLFRPSDIDAAVNLLANMERVGIDGVGGWNHE